MTLQVHPEELEISVADTGIGMPEEDGAPLDLFVQGVGALLSNKLLGLQPGEEQGAVGQVGQVGGLIQNDLEVLFTLLRGGVRLPQELRKAFDSGDRGIGMPEEVRSHVFDK